MKTKFSRLIIPLSVAMFASGFAPLAMSQDTNTDTDEEELMLEEVVVTGQRREQSILDVPIAATVFSGAELDQQDITDAKGFLLQTPNVSFQQGGRNGQREIIIAIRGISDLKSGEKVNQASAFATYYNDLGIGQLATGQPNPSLYDAAGVEVLAGPQGVFFGKNAEGGALVIHSNKPSEEVYGRVDVGIGTWSTYTASGVMNFPITDNLYTRLTLDSSKSDGPFENAVAGATDTETEYVMTRWQLRWEPSDATTVDWFSEYTIDNNNHQPKLPTCTNTYFGGDPFDYTTGRDIGCYNIDNVFEDSITDAGGTVPDYRKNTSHIAADADEYSDARTAIFILNINHEFNENMNLVSITGYVDAKMDQQLDLDASGRDFLIRRGDFKSTGFSQELRLNGTNGSFDWTVGGFYYDDENYAANVIEIRDFLGPWMKGDYANENNITDSRSGYAAFGNLEWHINDQWSLIGGLRYSYDKIENEWDEVYSACPHQAFGDDLATTPNECQYRPDQIDNGLTYAPDGNGDIRQTGGRWEQLLGRYGKNTGNDTSWRVAVNWQPTEDFSGYGSISKGYKPAGVRANPDGGFENVSLYDKETLTNYEIGFHSYFMDRRLYLAGALFYMTWEDMQVDVRQAFCRVGTELIPQRIFELTNDPLDCEITQVDRTENADKAVSKGLELSATYLFTDAFKMNASLGLLDAKFKRYIGNVEGTDQDLSGSDIGAAPGTTANVNATYTFFDVLGGELYTNLNWSYRGSVSNARSKVSGFPQEIPSYSLVNLSINQIWDTQRLSFTVKNLLDKEYFTSSDNSMIGRAVTFNPRYYMLRWTMEFGL